MATITDIIQSTRNAPPPHPTPVFFGTSITRKKGLLLFLNHRKKIAAASKELYHDKSIRSPDDTVVLFCFVFLKVSLCKTRAFTWCTMWSHHLPRNNIAERHGTKGTLNRPFWIQGSLTSWLCLTVFFLTMKSDRLKCQVHPVGDAFPFLLGLPSHLASRSRSSEKLQCPEGAGISLMWRAFKRRFNLLLARILQNTVDLDGSSFTMWTSYSTKVALLDDETSEQHNEKEKWNE